MQIRFNEVKTIGFLNNFIDSFWRCENTSGTKSEHTIIPDGYFSLIATYINGELIKIELHGIYTKHKNITIPESAVIFGVHFKLIAAEYLFNTEFKPQLNQTLLLPIYYGNINLLNVNDFDSFIIQTKNNIRKSIKQYRYPDKKKLTLFKLIYQNKIKTTKELALQTNWSTRQINRYFSNNYGFTIKELIKIIRCRTNIFQLTTNNLQPKHQYYDQSHFIKEVRQYTGTTPRILNKNKNHRFLQLLIK